MFISGHVRLDENQDDHELMAVRLEHQGLGLAAVLLLKESFFFFLNSYIVSTPLPCHSATLDTGVTTVAFYLWFHLWNCHRCGRVCLNCWHTRDASNEQRLETQTDTGICVFMFFSMKPTVRGLADSLPAFSHPGLCRLMNDPKRCWLYPELQGCSESLAHHL